MKNLQSLTVGEKTIKVGDTVVYNLSPCEVTAIYNYTDEPTQGYGPMMDLRFVTGGTVSHVCPGLDPRFHL